MADYHLISNGSHLWKYNSHLLRTPLTKAISIVPDEMAYYDVAGSYSNAIPTAGVISTSESNIYLNTVKSGKTMRKYYLGTNAPSNQIWRQVTTSHEPEFVFYHGAFSPAANNSAAGYGYGEAFMKIPAYHFTIPERYQNWNVYAGGLTLTHGGCIHSYAFPSDTHKGNQRSDSQLPYYTHQAPTSRLPSGDEWRTTTWTQKLGVYANLSNPPRTMHNSTTQEVELATGDITTDNLYTYNGSYYFANLGKRLIWSNTYVGYYDGNIPIAPNTWNQQITLNAATCAALTNLGGGWICITPNVAVSSSSTDSTSGDYPYYYPSSSAGMPWWICCSYWGFKLNLTLEL